MAQESLMYQHPPSGAQSYGGTNSYTTMGGGGVSETNQSNMRMKSQTVPGLPEHMNMPEGAHILSSKTSEITIRVPKRIIREEIMEESRTIKETVMEIAKPIYEERIVEVPEIEYRDKIKEVVERVIEEKIKEVPKIEYCERIIEVPKYVTKEKLVTIPQIEYRDVVYEELIELPEVHQNLTTKHVHVPTYIDEHGNPIEQPTVTIERKIPVPVEAVTTYEYQLAQMRPRVTKIQYPMYVPRFIPVPVVAETLEPEKIQAMQELANSVGKLVSPQAIGLHEIDELRIRASELDYVNQLPTHEKAEQVIRNKWLTGELQVNDSQVQTKIM